MDLESTLRDLAPRVIRYCIGYVGDSSLGEEIAQESLAALVAAWRASRPPAHPDAYVFAIARRRAARAALRRRLMMPLAYLASHRHPAPDPERAAIAQDERARLRSAIRRLPALERDALLLVAGGDLSVPEAASHAGVSLSAMKMRLMRARQRLLVLMKDDHGR